MFAMLFPEKLADAAMAQAEHMANVDPIPFAQRPRRIAALERPPPLVTWLIMCSISRPWISLCVQRLTARESCGHRPIRARHRRGLNEFCRFSYSFALRTAIELSASAAALSNCCSSQGDTPRRPFTTSRAHPTYSNLRFTDQWGA